MRRVSEMAGFSPAIWGIWMRRAISISPGGHRICIFRADRISIRWEIEEKILEHPAVTETAVFGMPDPKWGEIGVAVCTLTPGHSLRAEELETYLRAHVASYKIPKQFHFWQEIPKSGVGKLAKRLIRAELERRIEAGEA